MQLENIISEVELYLNLTRHLTHIPETKIEITKTKETLIDRLTSILMDKKLSHKKKCKLCETMLDLTHPFPYCEDCYESKIAINYNRFSYD